MSLGQKEAMFDFMGDRGMMLALLLMILVTCLFFLKQMCNNNVMKMVMKIYI